MNRINFTFKCHKSYFILFSKSIWNDWTTYTADNIDDGRLYRYIPLNCTGIRKRDKFLPIKTHLNDWHWKVSIVIIKLILKFWFVFTFCSERNKLRPLASHHGNVIEGSCRQRNLIFKTNCLKKNRMWKKEQMTIFRILFLIKLLYVFNDCCYLK